MFVKFFLIFFSKSFKKDKKSCLVLGCLSRIYLYKTYFCYSNKKADGN